MTTILTLTLPAVFVDDHLSRMYDAPGYGGQPLAANDGSLPDSGRTVLIRRDGVKSVRAEWSAPALADLAHDAAFYADNSGGFDAPLVASARNTLRGLLREMRKARAERQAQEDDADHRPPEARAAVLARLDREAAAWREVMASARWTAIGKRLTTEFVNPQQ